MIQKLTDAIASIEGENLRGVTWPKISEVASGEWGIGCQPVTTEAVTPRPGERQGEARP
jgi:4-oxalocrotonate tautomerase